MIRQYRIQIVTGLFLTAMTLFCYWQVQRFDFINLDDTDYVTENRRVRDGITLEGAKWAFTTNRSANWHPLTWLSHMLDCELYGLNPTGHHWTSLMFHMANSLLLFLVFNQMTGTVRRSAFLAALFALHPLHVESVAWVSERKDVLSTFFGLLSIAAYIRFVRKRRLFSYFLCMLFLCLGLMAKPMLVTLPFVLILLDYWPLGRFDTDTDVRPPTGGIVWGHRVLDLVREKIPLFVLVFLSSIVTLAAQSSKGAVQTLDVFPFPVRLSNALVSYAKYIYKTVWPLHLSIHYPHPGDALPVWQSAGAGVFIAVVTYWAVRRARAYPYVAVGWFWFLGTLVPVIGLIQVGGQAMADRYTYIPVVGLLLIFTWGATALFENSRWRNGALAAGAVIILSALAIRTYAQIGHWENSITLYENAIRVNDRSDLVHNNLGSALLDQDFPDKAAFHFKKALGINPVNEDARNNLGNLLVDRGNFEEAERHYRKILRNNPEHAIAHYNLGILLLKKNQPKAAYLHFAEAIKINPDFAEAYNYIGVLLARQGKFNEASVFYAKSLQINPDLAVVRRNFERNKRRMSHEQGFR
ncbi:tetratricopeptide repeat protein [Thermodesulfobacteriota bacterium]